MFLKNLKSLKQRLLYFCISVFYFSTCMDISYMVFSSNIIGEKAAASEYYNEMIFHPWHLYTIKLTVECLGGSTNTHQERHTCMQDSKKLYLLIFLSFLPFFIFSEYLSLPLSRPVSFSVFRCLR